MLKLLHLKLNTPLLISLLLLLFTSFTISVKVRAFQRNYVQSTTDLQELERFEKQIVTNITQVYLTSEALNLDSEIKRLVEIYLLDFYETSGFADVKDAILGQGVEISQNPICGYRLFRRVKFFLRHLVFRTTFFQTFGDMARNVFLFFWENGWPSGKCLSDGTHAIFKIQEVYDFDVDQFGNGEISNVQTNCSMDSVSCQEVAATFGMNNDIASQIQWLDIAVDKALQDRKTSVPFLQMKLRRSITKHNMDFDEETMMEFGDKWFDREIQHVSGDGRRAKKLRTLRYETLIKTRKLPYDFNMDYWAVCNGENFQTEAEKSLLFCWYEFKTHGSLAIGPAKMEFLSRDPDVVQIYEVLSENRTQALISARSRQEPSVIEDFTHGHISGTTKSGVEYHRDGRTSMTAWLTETETPGINQRIQRLIGLDIMDYSSADKLQVASCTFAGYFEPHMDEVPVLPEVTHRIATFMFYLNNVQAGGYTAFPILGFAARPVKGSGILWYNLYSDGQADKLTLHASCPLSLGEKWVATKWIWAGGQFLLRKCDLKPEKRHHVRVNGVVSRPGQS